VAREWLLHESFYYDLRTTKCDPDTHACIHPRIAVRNAEKLTKLRDLEKDIIIKHMWGPTLCPPKYKEGYIVTIVDKYSATAEYSEHLVQKVEKLFRGRKNSTAFDFEKVSK